ncbi:MAG: diguanylate cyclase [Deltaproteobacteria bacterium]|nr:MAG: diguanylate cyclase [Deltaproteobacteria bacterium]
MPRRRMNLKFAFLLLAVFLFLIATAAIVWSVRTNANDITQQWAAKFIWKQVLYDKTQILQPIYREITLARQLAKSPALIEWARSPEDPVLKRSGLRLLENFRYNFIDNNYFAVFLANRQYYYNNSNNDFDGQQLRYVLNSQATEDQWFFRTVNGKDPLQLNVSLDRALGITRLWINSLIRDGDEVLGLVGTGMDLTLFTEQLALNKESGIQSFFVDAYGQIQLSHDGFLVDAGYKDAKDRGLERIFADSGTLERLEKAFGELKSRRKSVSTVLVRSGGHPYLVGIVYLPEIDWFELTMINLQTVLPLSQFSTLIFVLIGVLLLSILVFNLALNHFLINPIASLTAAMGRVQDGEAPEEELQSEGIGEVAQLVEHFKEMANVVLLSRRDLERKVKQRTLSLERVASLDPLTGLLNRRGMLRCIENRLDQARREQNTAGLLCLDVDWFKKINDKHGHGAGDQVLVAVADIIRENIRSFDQASRWGGDEFLVLLHPISRDNLKILGERICQQVSEHGCLEGEIRLSVSVGGCLSKPDYGAEQFLHGADQALYLAKEAGRSCYRAWPKAE